MISEEEINHTVKKGDYYAIKSMLPELNGGIIGSNQKTLSKEFSSGDSVLNFEETIQLLKDNNLLNYDLTQEKEGELLR